MSDHKPDTTVLDALREPCAELIEHAGRAIWDDRLPDEDPRWHELNDETRHVYRMEAEAALRAAAMWLEALHV